MAAPPHEAADDALVLPNLQDGVWSDPPWQTWYGLYLGIKALRKPADGKPTWLSGIDRISLRRGF